MAQAIKVLTTTPDELDSSHMCVHARGAWTLILTLDPLFIYSP